LVQFASSFSNSLRERAKERIEGGIKAEEFGFWHGSGWDPGQSFSGI
jgi:hypothetical protein